MSPENGSTSIIHVTTTRSSPLHERLRKATAFESRSVPPAELEAALETRAEREPHRKNGFSRPVAVVLELECPDQTEATLECIEAVSPEVTTIVAPPTGSEALATVAMRGNADEYIPIDGDPIDGTSGDPIDRISEAIRARKQTNSSENPAAGTESTASAGPATSADGAAAPTDHRETPRPSDDATDRAYHRILANELPDEAFLINAGGTYLEAKMRPDAAELYSTSADEMAGHNLTDIFPDETATRLQACIDRSLETDGIESIEYEAETDGGRRRYEGRIVPIGERVDGQRAVVWLARDITERAKRERELRSRQEQLETLNRIGTVIGQVINTLVEAPSRAAIEREVCEQLVESELYCGSWIAERTGEGSLAYRTGAGSEAPLLEYARELTADHECFLHRTVTTAELQIESDLTDSEGIPKPLQDVAREHEVESVIAVPITHNESVYGVLTVLVGREEAFSEDERAGFALLGEMIGFTIMAVKNRQLLFADTVVELEFRIDGGDTFSFDLSSEYDCSCSLEWAGTTSNGRTVQYVTVDGIDGETVLEAANGHESVENCRLIHDGGNTCTIEMRLSQSGVRALANHGATIRDVTVENGVGTCLIEVSQDADVRGIAEALTVIYEHTELVARREVDRTVQTAAERRDRMLDRLTDRQLTTLRLAYYSGFFDWPRESTGEEIADAMDVSPPTMHQHLRKGLKSVLNEFFEGGGSGRER